MTETVQDRVIATLQDAGGALVWAVLTERVGSDRETAQAVRRMASAGLVQIAGRGERIRPNSLVSLAPAGSGSAYGRAGGPLSGQPDANAA